MQPIQVRYHWKTAARLKGFKKAMEVEGRYREARRAHAVLMNMQGGTTGMIAHILDVSPSNVRVWLQNWTDSGIEGLIEGHRSGRPAELSPTQAQALADIIDSGPIAYGFHSGVWTAPMVVRVIETEFGVAYHAGHVRRILHQLGFSVQRPRRLLIRADRQKQRKWTHYTYPRIKRRVQSEGAALLFEDEASFRQDPTLYQTWARVGKQPLIPTTGQRNTQKIFGAINLYGSRFIYHQEAVFNAATYWPFLEHIVRAHFPQKCHVIHDNASYHKDADVVLWAAEHRAYMELHRLPPYSPDLNATERIWHHVRMTATHNRYFPQPDELRRTLRATFCSIQRRPEQIRGYLAPFI